MNLVALIGNVSSEPKLTVTPSGTSVCEFSLTVSSLNESNTVSIITTDRQAEIAKEYLKNGRRVGIEGRLRNTDGKIEVIAHRVQLLGKQAEVLA